MTQDAQCITLEAKPQAKRDAILQLATQYGARNVRIFGSVARQESDPKSDIDFLVDMEQGCSLLDWGGLLMELQNLLGCRVDIVTAKGLRNRIRQRVLDEAIFL
ncbi:MAG: nucleotidyltransferase [Oscillatoriales cyanobacterium]|nr:MAG: nucleotidyltransferase [Oscillatoriales cyanobacterium]